MNPISLFASQTRVQGTLSCPYIHAELASAGDGKTGVNCRSITHSVRIQILPEDRMPWDRPKSNTSFPRLVAINVLAPPFVFWRFKNRKVCPSSCHIIASRDIHKKRSQPISAVFGGCLQVRLEPIGVKIVFLSTVILHQLKRLKMASRDVKALES